MTKRKAGEGEEAVVPTKSRKAGVRTATAAVAAALAPVVAAVPAAATKAKKAVTLKDKILAILAKEEDLIGLASLKKKLLEQYDFPTDGADKANSNKLNKILKALVDEERNDFGKIGGSYHGGVNSPAYIAYDADRAAKQAAQDEWEAHRDELQCPYCMKWDDEMSVWKGEDSVARGGKYECSGCKKIYWTWISDYPTRKLGHQKEYKYSGLYHRY